ncbi:acetate/propionate family kinase [Leeuwenhoekiella nanhaiensis]|uniref:Acetate kinase n=1 Tax=Leeuwenhoekiella nanhaiensis TaxID=1655491 RepID=A0A2G1VQ42_9FLAO|nr:acetate kinase [Leeuwenhoekiella nanhaiensis]PHQ28882.1 acetate kinase [Leeuwenhoekiella nanhaiensis]
MNILVINSGSSSIKFQLIEMPMARVLASGMVERIGIEGGSIQYKSERGSLQEEGNFEDHNAGLKKIATVLMNPHSGVIDSADEVDAVGHRVVHGGQKFTETTRVDDAVKANIKRLFSLAPLHNPANLTGIEVAEELFPNAEQVCVFDTAFFSSIPQKAYQYAIPHQFLTEEHIRLYGFHGTSHKYVSAKAQEYLNKEDLKLITIHLGNGCSMTALINGKPIDTSLGFGPANGLVMGTRAGDIDQTVVLYLQQQLGYSVDEVNTILNKESGMLGLTGHSDLRDIEAKAEAGDAVCKLALELNAYRIRKYIGAYAAALNGVDALVFTAGIGENSSTIRKMVCDQMDFLGIAIDKEENAQRKKGIREIQSAEAKVKVLIIPTNEELEIANQVYDLVRATD